MGLLSKLFGEKEDTNSQTQNHQSPDKIYATVELKSPYLLAFDLPAEGVKYKISNFEPGIYKIPLEAIVKTTDSDQSSDSFIEVDTGVIYFIDAEYEELFRKFETQLFDETGDSYSITDNPDDFTEQIGIKFDCLMAPGVNSGYEFEGDGTYTLEISKILKV
ncbi:MAG: hypothetical protein ABIK92_17895 [Pseudomonadota bacterium]